MNDRDEVKSSENSDTIVHSGNNGNTAISVSDSKEVADSEGRSDEMKNGNDYTNDNTKDELQGATDIHNNSNYKDDKQIDKLLGKSDNDGSDINNKSNNNNELDELLGGSDDDGNNHDNASNNNELDELLGGSDDDDDMKVVNSSAVNKSEEIGHLFGESDDDSAKEMEVDGIPNVKSENNLDDILGKANDYKATAIEKKTKTNSNMRMPFTYKVPLNGNLKSLFVRTPNFMKIQSSAFDESSYDEDSERNKYDDANSIIRWRIKKDADGSTILDADGKPVIESNARMVQFSDGTMQLVVGDAIFQCKNIDIDNCFVYQQHNVIERRDGNRTDSVDEQESTCLDCVSMLNSRLVLQPSALNSDIHARMTMKIAEKFKKERKIQRLEDEDITENPFTKLAALAKEEEEENRKEMKLRQQHQSDRGLGRYRRPMMTADYLDSFGDDYGEYDEQDIGQIKRAGAKRKTNSRSRAEENSDDDVGEDIQYSDGDEEDEIPEELPGEFDDFIAADGEEEEPGSEEEEEEDDKSLEDFDDIPDNKHSKTKKDKKKKKKKSDKAASKKREATVAVSETAEKPKLQPETDAKATSSASREVTDAVTATAAPVAIVDDDEEDDLDMVHQRKRAKRTIVESDEED